MEDEIGPDVASKYAADMLNHHKSLRKPGSLCFLVGMAGGIWNESDDIRLGDVVIAKETFDWRTGKQTDQGLRFTRLLRPAPGPLRKKLGQILYEPGKFGKRIMRVVEQMQSRNEERDTKWNYPGAERDVLFHGDYLHTPGPTCKQCDRMQVQNRGNDRTDNLPPVYSGVIASGNVVLKSVKERELLQEFNVLAVEMEAAGVPDSFISVRGISDYADSHKNDIWQPYAAATASATVRILISIMTGEPMKTTAAKD